MFVKASENQWRNIFPDSELLVYSLSLEVQTCEEATSMEVVFEIKYN